MSDLRIEELESDSAEVRRRACEGIADAFEAGAPIDAAIGPVAARLADHDREVRALAAFILATAAEREIDVSSALPAIISALSDEDSDIRQNCRHALGSRIAHATTRMLLLQALSDPRAAVRRTVAELLATDDAERDDGDAVAALLRNQDGTVRLGVSSALAEGALPRHGTHALIEALAAAVGDAEPSVRKEAIWALYLFAFAGHDVDAALPALERALEDEATQGNAAIVVSLAWHASGQEARAAALRAHEKGTVQLGAAWGASDHHLKNGDVAALKAMFADEDVNVRRGLGGSLHHAKQCGRDMSLAAQVFRDLEREHPDDALLHARLYAVLSIVERGPE
jgi:HEAT repeat protein